ncbi:Serpentine receptor class beta-17 [Caenorhabditis elegans]|uniref:Serpentine receptor class beta-17 n=1 Tax=Caenorhabditis elegans TaxID=6239 RepID=SRB17_CAEEL|nr:Serpentine receptor class beta-17 [Caenorhabditis elegans]O02241.4 RecName: Full=Serpentine receptor class beta-17; Short=Protein srb-17 [Caenorhabditis elegans]CAB02886.4 Serpentine receptor class beta-17 [Caenorhabditis elegans]|eukprot:NP_501930.4 Serpentine receptor class beta-17 [Caenorhabditis elegans]
MPKTKLASSVELSFEEPELFVHMYDFAVEITDEFCQIAFPGAFHPAFLLVKLYHILLSVISMGSIIYFFLNYSNLLAFHFNIKILFFFQFCSCFLQSATLAISQTHHLVLALIANGPCDVILAPALFALFNLPLIFSMLCMEFSQVLMVIERTLASCLFVCYEKTTKTIGFVLTSFAVIVPGLTCLYMYYDDKFNYPQMSAMATSPSSKLRINYIFITINVLNVLTLMHSIGLYRHNKQKINMVKGRDHFILSSRFQMNENVSSSKLLWRLSCAQLIIFLLYGCAMYSLRIFLPGERSAVWQAVTEFCYTPPLYCAIMPLICIVCAQNSLKQRNSKVQSLITLRSVGQEGWDNYQGMLQKQWE